MENYLLQKSYVMYMYDECQCIVTLDMCIVKEALYRIWCGANRLGDSGVHTLGDNSAYVNPAGQLLLPGGVRPEWIPSA